MRGILEEQPAPALRRFVELAGLLLDIDKAQIEAVASSTIRYLHASKEERQRLRLNQELEQRWYASLATGAPDYAVYDSDLYLADLWACWIVYSRRYLMGLRSATVEEHGTLRAHIGARSIGHFDRYLVAGHKLDGRATARAFSGLLRQSGYRQIGTSLWNNRPTYWRRS